MDIKDLEKIIKIVKDNGITEFELNEGKTHLKLSRSFGKVIDGTTLVPRDTIEVRPAVTNIEGSSPVGSSNGAAKGKEASDDFYKLESPIVGTFYRRPSPDSDPFSKEGDTVKKGDTLCIVEAMKVMNEIESPVSGKIEKILIADGGVVEFGEVLFLINTEI